MRKELTFLLLVLISLISVDTLDTSGQLVPGVIASSNSGTTGTTLLNGLLGYWKLDESSGNLIDIHSTYDFTASNLTYSQTGIINTAIDFNGTTSYASNTDFVKPADGFSISLWFNSTGATSEMGLVWNSYNSGTTKGWRLGVATSSSGQVFGLITDATNPDWDHYLFSGLLNGAWHHAVFTYNDVTQTGYIYVDNVKSSGYTWAGSLVYQATAPAYFGRGQFAGNYYDGLMDEIGVWNRALTDTEVDLLFDKTPYGSF